MKQHMFMHVDARSRYCLFLNNTDTLDATPALLRVHHMLIIYFSWPTFVTRKVVASHEPLQVCLHGARELSRSEHLPELFDAAGA